MEKYNGYANFETWCVMLWIDNSQAVYNYFINIAREKETHETMDILKEYFEENSPLINEASLYADLLNGALSVVNWHEIATLLKEK